LVRPRDRYQLPSGAACIGLRYASVIPRSQMGGTARARMERILPE
jgi:hypothetical protein